MAQIITFKQVRDEVFNLYENGLQPGVKIGFETIDPLYSVKMGTTTIIYGHPTVGKSQFLHELLKSLTCVHGLKGLMYSPETGNAAEIFAELIHNITGKTFDKKFHFNRIAESELYQVIPFIESYYNIIEPTNERGLEYDEFFELAKQAIKDFGIKWTSIDNWNDIDHYTNGMMISEYLKKQLPKWNRFAKLNDIHNFMVCHARNPTIDKGEKFPTMPRPDEIEGGSVWYAKAMNLIGLHREYEERVNGFEQSTTLTVDIKKVKPRIVGSKGRATIVYNYYKNRYEHAGEFIRTPFTIEDNPQPTKTPF
jgi:twinkle protein